MQIAYIVDWKGNPNTGAPQKIQEQISVWRKNGLNVNLYIISPSKYRNEWAKKTNKVFTYSNFLQRVLARTYCSFTVIKSKDIDLVYRRFAIWEFFELISIVLKPTVIEINTNNKEYYKNKSSFFWLIYWLQNIFISKYIVGACSVTEELKELQSLKIKSKTRVFTNSIKIDSKSAEPVIYTRETAMQSSFVFLASDAFKWNGVNLLFALAKSFPKFNFHIVGLKGRDNQNVYWHNPMYDQDLISFLRTMDFGISTLAIDSLNLKQAAPLKSRTYLANGLPTIGAYEDSAFDKSDDFFFQIIFDHNSLQLMNKDDFLNFVKKWSGKKVDLHLLDSINSEIIEKNRAIFIRSLT